jgi:hypothetical protein
MDALNSAIEAGRRAVDEKTAISSAGNFAPGQVKQQAFFS